MKKYLTLILFFFLFSLAFINIPFVNANPDSITYNVGTNTITVIGTYTNLHWELWNASTVNDWGVVHKQGEANYLINNTIIQIGNGAITTVCSDLSVNVLFETNLQIGYRIKNYATLTFGRQDSGYATSAGVNVNFNSSYGGYAGRIFYGSSLGNLNLYSSSLRSTYTDVSIDAYASTIAYFGANRVTIYNCVFDKVYPATASGVDIYNLAVLRGIYGLSNIEGNLQQVFLYDCTYLLSFASASKITKNVYITTKETTSKIRYTGGGNDHYLINVIWSGANDWGFYWHNAVPTSIFRQYEFDLTVTYPNGTVINGTLTGARVEIQHYGNNSAVDYNATLNADGTINTTVLNMGFYNQTYGDVLQDYNPFNLCIYNVTGYVDYNGNFTLNKKEDLTIALISYSSLDYTIPIALLITVCSIIYMLVIAKIKMR